MIFIWNLRLGLKHFGLKVPSRFCMVKVLAVEASNLQDRFNGTKACLRVFWPRFQKQDGSHSRSIQIFRDFCCPSISKGMQCTLSKFAGYVHHGQSFLGNYSGYLDKNKMAAVGVSLTVFFTKYKKCKYHIFSKYGLGVNYFQMASDQALN